MTTEHPQNHFCPTCRYVLKNLMRDWSADGAPERTQSYGRIIKELAMRYQGWQDPQHPPRVLVPGESCHMLSKAAMAAAVGLKTLLNAARGGRTLNIRPGVWCLVSQVTYLAKSRIRGSHGCRIRFMDLVVRCKSAARDGGTLKPPSRIYAPGEIPQGS